MNMIHEIRKAAGMSQSALAALLGVTQPTISQYERDVTRPAVDHAIRLVELAKRHGKRVRLEDLYRRPKKESANV